MLQILTKYNQTCQKGRNKITDSDQIQIYFIQDFNILLLSSFLSDFHIQ